MVLFFGLARLSSGSVDYKGRLQRFAGDGRNADGGTRGAKDSTEGGEEKAEKKKFSLGIGESQLAARVDKAFGRQSYAKTVQRRLAQADLKLTLLEFILAKLFTTLALLGTGIFIGRGGA